MAINRIKTGGITDATIQSGDIAPGTIASDRLAGSVANAKLANSSITINGTAVALGGSVTAGTNWQAVVVADGSTTLTAVAGRGYFLDTNTGVIEVFLPTSPSRGDTIVLADYSGTFSTNKVLINTGGKNIDSTEVPGEFELTTNNTVLELVFVDNDKGWLAKQNEATSGPSLIDGGDYQPTAYVAATGGTITTSGDFKIHTFTGDANFVVSCGGNTKGSNQVSYLVIAGGGGAGGDGGGGGGAGGFREGKSPSTPYTASPLDAGSGLPVTAQTYPVTVGAGGAGGAQPTTGAAGSNSVFSTITSAGGGRGGGRGAAGNGGSGGGGDRGSPQAAGTGNTPPVSPAQGTNGAPGGPPNGDDGGGGGGGATDAGSSNGPSGGAGGGTGGDGASSEISGSAVTRAGGGGGGSSPKCVSSAGVAGAGGGGTGVTGGSNATSGSANTGGGGGGSSGGPGVPVTQGGSGGSGVVIIRYKFQN